jgi:hypothetical protein
MARPMAKPREVLKLRNSFLDKGRWKECNRRALRVDIRGSSCTAFLSFPELGPQRYQVFTLAELGAKFTSVGSKIPSLKGYNVDANLHLGPLQIPVQTKVVYADAATTAVEFVNPSESVRTLIRDMFELELTAAALVPFHNYSSAIPGPTHTTVYSDGDAHNLELIMTEDRLDGITGTLTVMDIRFVWMRNKPSPLRISSLNDERTHGPHLKRHLVSFLRNLQGLNPKIRDAIERAIAA